MVLLQLPPAVRSCVAVVSTTIVVPVVRSRQLLLSTTSNTNGVDDCCHSTFGWNRKRMTSVCACPSRHSSGTAATSSNNNQQRHLPVINYLPRRRDAFHFVSIRDYDCYGLPVVTNINIAWRMPYNSTTVDNNRQTHKQVRYHTTIVDHCPERWNRRGRHVRTLTSVTITGGTPQMMVMMRIPTIDEWNATMIHLLDENVYPIGFSNIKPPHESTTSSSLVTVTSWCQQVSQVLQQTTVFVVPNNTTATTTTMEPALRILDRLCAEHDAYIPTTGAGGGGGDSVNDTGTGCHDDGIFLSPHISSMAIATALETWKLSLEHLHSCAHNTRNSKDLSRARERVIRYGNYLAIHDGSLLSQISKIMDPTTRMVVLSTTIYNG